MTLHLHRSERADPLARALAATLREPLADPFTAEVVSVPARGVERWLVQQLSHHLGTDDDADGRDGVCANVEFPFPSVLVAGAVAAASDVDPAADPWAGDRSVWTLIDVIDRCVDEPWCALLARHLSRGGTNPTASDRRFVTAQHLAGLYSSYAQQRPAMLREWAASEPTDGAGEPLPDDLRWQAELWRQLRTEIGTPSPAERHDAACAALRANPMLVDLPSRVSVFGPTRLTAEQVTVLDALAEHRDIHLWLPHPSAALWDKVSAARPPGRPRRRDDPTASLPSNRLLASLGRDAREMQLALSGWSSDVTDTHYPLEAGDDETLLGRVQDALRTDTSPDRVDWAEGDDSLQVHACHGRTRQVEVLREVLLGLLQADETLEPRDVLVMCPDIESYAPLISATFGLGDGAEPRRPAHPGHLLRVRLADRSLRQTNPLLAVVSRLLELADGRVTASQVLDLAGLPPVRRRFRFDDDDLDRMRDWVSTSGVRWGLDAAHRAPFGLEGVAQNTWRAGLDRILLGVTMSEDDLVWLGSALPLDDVDSTDVDLAGRMAELVDRLTAPLDQLRDGKPLDAWLDAISRSLDALTSVAERDAWQLAQARRELAEVASTAGDAAARTTLRLADVRGLLADRLRGRPTRANFRTGNLTMCSMVPMRSVPHRVVCLIGLDDGVFPRTLGVDGDDVLARDPLVGERDRRSEDRQLLLDAVLAAQEHLVVLYTGADERTNAVRPPAVPLGELLDVVDAALEPPNGGRARDRVVVSHPLQPFDPRNFTAGVLGAPGPFSFDAEALNGAVAARHGGEEAPPVVPGPLPPGEPDEVVEIEDLWRFLEHPVKAFFRQRLRVSPASQEDVTADGFSMKLSPLEEWSVGDRGIELRLRGDSEGSIEAAELLRGVLPPGQLGANSLAKLRGEVDLIAKAARTERRGQPAHSVDVVIDLPDGRSLAATVPGIHGGHLVRGTFSKLKPRQRLRSWVLLCALAAAIDQPWTAVTIGRNPNGPGAPRRADVVALDQPLARQVLAELVAIRDRGLRAPLVLPAEAALEYARKRQAGNSIEDAESAATRAWDKDYERKDEWHGKAWNVSPAPWSALPSSPASPGDQPASAEPRPVEPALFGALACRVWWPLLDHESVSSA